MSLQSNILTVSKFQYGKTQNLLWPVNATDQWNCLLHNQLHLNYNFPIVCTTNLDQAWALWWFIDCKSIDWNIDNAWAAGLGNISLEVSTTVLRAVYLSR